MRLSALIYTRPDLLRCLLPLAAVMISATATAAPLCVAVQGLPIQCLYADANLCQTRANQLHGVCVANASEVILGVGPGRFCLVVGSEATQCIYADRSSCELDAARHHTACVQTQGQPGTSVSDPFATRRPY